MYTDKNPTATVRATYELENIEDVLSHVRALMTVTAEDCQKLTGLNLRQVFARNEAELSMQVIGKAFQEMEALVRVGVEISSELGVPQRKLAELVGVAPATILRWIRNPIGFDAEGLEAMEEAEIKYRDEEAERYRLGSS